MANLVTESALQLFNAAECDINTLNSIMKDKDVPENYKNEQICYHSTQAVEKFIKGWIINNQGSVEKSHDLKYIWKTACVINNIFDPIRDDCLKLNKYTPGARYGSSIPITLDEIKEIKKSLNIIITFEPINSLRATFSNEPDSRKLYDKVIEDTQQQDIEPTPAEGT